MLAIPKHSTENDFKEKGAGRKQVENATLTKNDMNVL